jgi:hypothetical protein
VGAWVGLVIIYRQTVATKNAAKAAFLNAQAVINSQRAWIAIRTREPHIPDSFEFQAVCLVGTPAKIIHNYAKWQTVEKGQSFQPTYETEMLQFPFLIGPSDGKRKICDFSMESFKSNALLWKDIQSGDKTLYFFGKIEYTDAISIDSKGNPITHESRWCYEYVGGSIFRSGALGMNDCN